MRWSFTIAKICGTQVRIHLTFVLFILILATQFYVGYGLEHAIRGTLLVAGIFLCVLLHEFGHVAAALRYGITTPKITLLPIGGMASLTKIPREPVKEFVVAIAGPMVNVVIALVLILVRGGLPDWRLPEFTEANFSLIDTLIWINILLVAFNMIPAFPMDGGRVLRAFLASFLSRSTATHLAARIGQVFAIAGVIWAIQTGQIILGFIAVFIFFAGKGEETMVDQESLLEGHTAGEAGMTDFKTFRLDDSLRDVLAMILQGDQDSFPVVNNSRDCIAALSFEEVVSTIQHKGSDALVRDAVDAIPEQIKENTSAFEALQKLRRSRQSGVAVVDENGHLKKWLTRRQFGEFMAVQALAVHPSPRRAPGAIAKSD